MFRKHWILDHCTHNYLSSPSTIVIPTDFGLPSPSAPEAPTTLGVEGTQAIVPLTLPKLADAGEQHDDENFTVYNFLHEGASESTSERIGWQIDVYKLANFICSYSRCVLYSNWYSLLSSSCGLVSFIFWTLSSSLLYSTT